MGLLEIIDRTWVGTFVRRKADLILETDPDKIYVENIRSFFGVTNRMAKAMCEFAVKAGHFTKHIGFICPNVNCKKIIIEFSFKEVLEMDEVECLNCLLREEQNSKWDILDIEKIEFYRLNKGGKNAS
ncbi:hypothetical protein BCY89_28020 [Sphingobacterium siyangense]|uniref:Uncharacterized protein n=1 Tax=Sphingobacterium siyangense TaxID=459529 RepID=A0A420FT37_9SPHI|nr:hypothetical protein [Sphingobacterium siyangense]RKF36068.1 hypothetical protein BCY89_28020 [Sphingobacterium siyangense]